MTAIVSRQELDGMGCGMPDCGHDHSQLYIHCRKHMGGKLEVHYDKPTGRAVVTCMVCKEPVVELVVADKK